MYNKIGEARSIEIKSFVGFRSGCSPGTFLSGLGGGQCFLSRGSLRCPLREHGSLLPRKSVALAKNFSIRVPRGEQMKIYCSVSRDDSNAMIVKLVCCVVVISAYLL